MTYVRCGCLEHDWSHCTAQFESRAQTGQQSGLGADRQGGDQSGVEAACICNVDAAGLP